MELLNNKIMIWEAVNMIQLIVGRKGTGKTKTLIGMANETVKDSRGEVVFITSERKSMLELDYQVRLIKTQDFGIKGFEQFYAFLCGIIAENYDIDQIYIDGLLEILGDNLKSLEAFMFSIKKLSNEYSIKFTISMCGDPESVPAFLQEYIA